MTQIMEVIAAEIFGYFLACFVQKATPGGLTLPIESSNVYSG